MPSFDIIQFKITDDAIIKFRRWVKKPRDCVINALELLNILDQQSADIARIMAGNEGLTIEQIEEIFSLIEPNFNWRFVRLLKLKKILDYARKNLDQSNAIFCGYMDKKTTQHVFLIAKDMDNKVVYIDPSLNMLCDLNTIQCQNLITDKTFYYILQASPKN